MKAWVRVDVCNLSPRAFLIDKPSMATGETGRVVQAIQGVDWEAKIGKNIFPELPAKTQKKITKMCGMLGVSGPRGDMEIDIPLSLQPQQN